MSEELAKKFHETYERLAPDFGYKTRDASAVPWEDVPEANKNLMIAVCAELESQNATLLTNVGELVEAVKQCQAPLLESSIDEDIWLKQVQAVDTAIAKLKQEEETT